MATLITHVNAAYTIIFTWIHEKKVCWILRWQIHRNSDISIYDSILLFYMFNKCPGPGQSTIFLLEILLLVWAPVSFNSGLDRFSMPLSISIPWFFCDNSEHWMESKIRRKLGYRFRFCITVPVSESWCAFIISVDFLCSCSISLSVHSCWAIFHELFARAPRTIPHFFPRIETFSSLRYRFSRSPTAIDVEHGPSLNQMLFKRTSDVLLGSHLSHARNCNANWTERR